MRKKRIHVFITGNVQGVFFRASCKDEADRLGVHGWIKNLPDGRVEAIFEASEEKLNQMIFWCFSGSESSNVTNIEKHEEEIEGLKRFEILLS